jgi:3-hydroxyisobutyrate dehydrogenase
MGGALARRLQLAVPVTVYDLSTEAVQGLVAEGARAAADLPDLGESCDVVITCLPTSEHVRAALFGDGGLAHVVKPGALVIDQSSGDPPVTRQLAAELKERGIDLVDAPVSGGPKGAEAGTIAIMVGAEPEPFRRAESVLKHISSRIFHAGGIGAGHTVKLVNNLISCTMRLLTFEAMALADKNGVDPALAAEIVNASGGRNAYVERILIPHVLRGDLTAGYTLGLAQKDLRQACDLGQQSGVPLMIGNISRELYQMCVNEMGADTKVDAAALVIDRIACTEVVPKPYTL